MKAISKKHKKLFVMAQRHRATTIEDRFANIFAQQIRLELDKEILADMYTAVGVDSSAIPALLDAYEAKFMKEADTGIKRRIMPVKIDTVAVKTVPSRTIRTNWSVK